MQTESIRHPRSLVLLSVVFAIAAWPVNAQKLPKDVMRKPNIRVCDPTKVVYPIKGSRRTELGHSHHMKTDITISNNGALNATTRTWSSEALRGFTGAVAVLLTDCDAVVLWKSREHSYGVNGTAMGNDSRTENWFDTIPREKMANVGGFVILHRNNPTDRWYDSFKQALKWYQEGRQAYDEWQQAGQQQDQTGQRY